jgi:quinohemoprotein ethanol dehydrogenase
MPHPRTLRLRRIVLPALALALLLPASSLAATDADPTELDATPAAGAAAAAPGWGRVDQQRVDAADQEPGSWLVHGRTWDEQRFSPLARIHRENVASLGPAWSFMTGTRRGLEATPIVVDGVLYATGSWSVVFALDAATGRELWRFDPKVPRAKARDACCDVVNRGVAVWQGRVFVGTLDGRLIALDAATGEPVWEVLTVDPRRPYTITGAPRIAKGRIVIGNGGADFGVRGYFSAYDPDDGGLLWRFYTVPASREGPHEHPELGLAAETWSKQSMWESGLGGTVWDSMAYDPELDLLYVGVGNSSVYKRDVRSPGGGDNLFLSSILAVRPETGRLVWHYQTTPGEAWDYTATQHMILADLQLGGRLRKVLLQAPKNGFFYVLDRATGELLSAEKYAPASWATHVDLATGRPVERPEADWTQGPALVTPFVPGAHSWHPMSFHPETGLVYVPVNHGTYYFTPARDFRYRPGRFNTGEDFGALLAEVEGYEEIGLMGCSPTRLLAWDPVAQEPVWEVGHDTGVNGGVLSTAGGLVFQGSGTGELVAYDARTGERRWASPVGVGIMAPPISYEIDGVQYLVVLAGIGGSQGGHFTRFDYENHGRILAFRLGGQAPLPPVRKRAPRRVEAPRLAVSQESLERGRSLYGEHCMRCHGVGVKSSGLYPDLRMAPRQSFEQWDAIVLGGIRSGGGMAGFADVLTAAQSQEIRAYVAARALHEPNLAQQAVSYLHDKICLPVTWFVD